MIQEYKIITRHESEVINKKLLNKKLSQQDSNCLSRYIRPKLREIAQIDSKLLLRKLEYNQKTKAIEKYIKTLIIKNIDDVSSIIIYGSAVFNNYHDYNDIDLLVTLKKKYWENKNEKHLKIIDIKRKAEHKGISLDLEIYPEKEVVETYPSNPSLIYQLNDKKIIYGRLILRNKAEIPKLYLRMKLDYSYVYEEDFEDISGSDLYKAIRNLWLVRLLIEKKVDNFLLKSIISDELGKNIIERLKTNKNTLLDKKIAWIYLKEYLKKTENLINNSKWEKIAFRIQ